MRRPYNINGTKCFKAEQNVSKWNKMFQNGTLGTSGTSATFGTLETSATLATFTASATLATSSVPASAFLSVWATEDEAAGERLVRGFRRRRAWCS
jgi:hypothetical protein